jgi:hypothetical protein
VINYQNSNDSSDPPHYDQFEIYLLLLWSEGQSVHINQTTDLFLPCSIPKIGMSNISFKPSDEAMDKVVHCTQDNKANEIHG